MSKNRKWYSTEMKKLVDDALDLIEESDEIDSFLAAFVLMHERWLNDQEDAGDDE